MYILCIYLRSINAVEVSRKYELTLFVIVLTGMSQAECPETQVGCSVGNAAQAVLYGVDGLVQ